MKRGTIDMKKTYIIPVTEIECADGPILLAGTSGVKGKLDDTLEIGWGGVDEDGDITPSSNCFVGWDDGSWDKL